MRTLAALLLVLAAAGCRYSMAEVVGEKESGTAAVYPVDAAKAWEVAAEVLWDATRVNPEEYRDRGFLCVKGGLGDNETFLCVWIDPKPKEGWTGVTVVSRRANGMQLATALTEDDFHANFVRKARLPAPKE